MRDSLFYLPCRIAVQAFGVQEVGATIRSLIASLFHTSHLLPFRSAYSRRAVTTEFL
jgi:hypothetical protein